MSETVIVAAKRTPIGSFNGALSSTPAPKLGAIAIKAAVEAAGLRPSDIEDVIMGNVLTAAEGQAPARQALIYAGLPPSTGALTIGKVCGSGLKAVMLAEQSIRCGDANVVVAGGMETMSLAPYVLEQARQGLRMGDSKLVDVMIKDGLWDPYSNCHMGNIAEKCVAEYKMSREAQDEFAKMSYERALNAIQNHRFKEEIVPVEIPQKKGDPVLFSVDEEPGKGSPTKLSFLRPAFDKNGSITAGNASSINDGAAALVLMSADKARQMGVKPLVRIVAHAQSSQEPEWFTTAPAVAMEKALKKAGLKASDIDLWEVNEAFAVVSLVNNDKLKIPADRCNVNGGAVALGHPIGASGARILVTLIHEMLKRPEAKRGLASLCIGGGEGVALIVEKI
jgi:acetyl-CoA C-acetyltransferase